jgi:DNA-binding response OmpR family regulator
MRVLIVEDKVRMAGLLQRAVQREGYLTLVAHDGEAALEAVNSHHFDALILDVMIPKLDGFAVLDELRRSEIRVPTILLTAKDSARDIVHGLDLGADDYLTKPFDLDVLLARLRALTRRAPALYQEPLRIGGLLLRNDTHSVECGDETIALTPTEFALMEVLIRHAGRVVRKETLAEIGWGLDSEFSDDTLYVFIRSLRNKISFRHQPVVLHTVRGVGYMLKGVAA